MPIITPAYPVFNTTFNVSKTTKNIILKEFKKAKEVVRKILDKKIPWNRLFKKLDFLKAYRFYLKIDVLTKIYDHQRFFGYVESKLKKLILEFEKYEASIAYSGYLIPEISIHPWMTSYQLSDKEYDKCECFFFGLDLKTRKPIESSEPAEDEEPLEENLENGPKEQEKSYIRVDDIINNFYASLLPDESNLVQDFPKDEFPHNVNIRIKVVKRAEIPDILNPPEIESIDDEVYNPNFDIDLGDSNSKLTGAKRNRYDDLDSPTINQRGFDSKRAKLYE